MQSSESDDFHIYVTIIDELKCDFNIITCLARAKTKLDIGKLTYYFLHNSRIKRDI